MSINQLASEYEQLISMRLWGMFLDEITERRKLAQRDCETREDVRKSQGEILAYDWILGKRDQPALIERIILKLKGQSITQEVIR